MNIKDVEKKENYQTLYDYIIKKGGIDIADDTYDMMVYCDFDEEEIGRDSFDSCISEICKKLEIKEIKNNIAIVNLTEFIEKNQDKFLRVITLKTLGESDEEIKEELVCNAMPSIMSGYGTDSFYKNLMNLLVNCNEEEKAR